MAGVEWRWGSFVTPTYGVPRGKWSVVATVRADAGECAGLLAERRAGDRRTGCPRCRLRNRSSPSSQHGAEPTGDPPRAPSVPNARQTPV